jgi:phage tail protein X
MDPVIYVVKPGDTLSEIALWFYGNGTEPYWRRIYNANKSVIGNDPNVIKPGELIKIPFPPIIPPNHKYTVKPGDTLSNIALHFYGDGTEPAWRKIYDANRSLISADPNLIKPGEPLTIPTLGLPGELPTRVGEEIFVPVHYATNRNATGAKEANRYYGSERERGRNPLHYGVAYISIPKEHDLGALERPRFWRFQFSENPKKHIMLRSLAEMKKLQFFDHLKDDMALLTEKTAFVFIHGFNVTFAAGAHVQRKWPTIYFLSDKRPERPRFRLCQSFIVGHLTARQFCIPTTRAMPTLAVAT